MKKSMIKSVVVAAIVLAAAAFSSPAAAATLKVPADPTAPDSSAVQEYLLDQGVEPDVIAALIEKIERGKLMDSQKAHAKPISTVTDGGVTRMVYQDGSVRLVELSDAESSDSGPSLGLLTETVSGCTNIGYGSGSATYSGCLVKTTDGITVLSFRTGYSRWPGGASVQNWYGASAATAYGSTSTAKFTFTRANYNGAPAVVQAHTRFVSWNGLSSEDIYLNFNVTPNGYTVTIY